MLISFSIAGPLRENYTELWLDHSQTVPLPARISIRQTYRMLRQGGMVKGLRPGLPPHLARAVIIRTLIDGRAIGRAIGQ